MNGSQNSWGGVLWAAFLSLSFSFSGFLPFFLGVFFFFWGGSVGFCPGWTAEKPAVIGGGSFEAFLDCY